MKNFDVSNELNNFVVIIRVMFNPETSTPYIHYDTGKLSKYSKLFLTRKMRHQT